MATRAKSKRRSPLMESDTEEALRRRGAELIGLILVAIGVLGWAMIWTYSPDDPSLFSATDAEPTNALGLIGASIADPLHRALGWAAYGVPAAFLAWGLRLALHAGEGRALRRIIALPVALLIGAAFASTHVPFAGWPHAYGLGGLLGDAALGRILSLIPLDLTLTLPIASVVLAALLLAVGGYALGVAWPEVGAAARFMGQGSVLLYAGAHGLTGRALSGAVQGARQAGSLAVETARNRRAAASAEPPHPRPGGGAIPRFAAGSAAPAHGRRIAPAVEAPVVSAPVSALPVAFEGADGGFNPGLTADPTPQPRVQKAQRLLAKSLKARAEEQPSLVFDEDAPDGWTSPPLSLLENPATIVRHHLSTDALEENARMLENVLDDYGVRGEIVAIRPGPVVTMYELEPAAGLKASRVIGLADDIARSMSALACRVSTIPGRSVIGIELPNDNREKVLLREILSAKSYGDSSHALPLALGKDIGGEPVVANLARMPHLLIAGTTGSGKSVAINTMILSLLYKLSPKDCRLIMIDPKMLELSVYDGIPHLLSPVVTDPRKAVAALKWVVAEMEDRYRKMSKMGVRNIDGYNQRVEDALARGEAFTRTVQTGFDDDTGEPVFETEEFQPQAMAYIVVIVDEMADLMMVAGKEIEACIQRLAQMARASGIHLIMATQRPSVDVITGTIKANFPTRISFQVTSKIDSRTILGEMGAEQLLGQGDMLYMAGGGRITRVHGPFVSDEEVEEVVTCLKSMGSPEYEAGVVEGPDADDESEIDLVLGLGGAGANSDDALYDQAVAIVAKDRKCSTSYIQRKLSVGYNKAAKLVEMMEDQGVVSQANHVGKREVLVAER